MEWISVEDRLPSPNVPILIFYKTIFTNSTQSVGIYFDGKEFRQLIGGAFLKETPVTHWMPLPEPPQD